VKLFLCGDVMTGRGVDQILPVPCDPALDEPWVKSALDYVALAEGRNGPIPRPVDFAYVWGDALEELEWERPEARIVNLETAVTTSEDREPKGIHYRMNPANVACLAAGAGRDAAEAEAPAVIALAGERRVLVFAFGPHHPGPIENYRGRLLTLALTPMRIARLRLHRASLAESDWLAQVLGRESGVAIARLRDGRLLVSGQPSFAAT
jgi:poly-gamma-glutamate synthesis protein (capsule biosynthesis protein)